MVLIVAQTVNTCTAGAVLALMVIDIDAVQPWHAFAAIFIQGAVRAVEDPSRRTGILDIVGPSRLVNALSLEIFTNTAGKMTGPLLAGIVLAAVGFQGSYVLVVAIHLANLWLATQLKIPQSQGSPPREPVWRSLAVGFRYALRSRELLAVMYVTIFMNALAFPVQQFVPAVGRDNLHVGIGLVGLLVAAEGFGQLAGAAALALGRGSGNRGAVFVMGSALVLAVGLAFAWAPWYSAGAAGPGDWRHGASRLRRNAERNHPAGRAAGDAGQNDGRPIPVHRDRHNPGHVGNGFDRQPFQHPMGNFRERPGRDAPGGPGAGLLHAGPPAGG